MTVRWLVQLAVLAAAVACSRPPRPEAAEVRTGAPAVVRAAPTPPGPFAVVELFTSEGCSSCPPADENLARIAADAAGSGKRVFALSFHVDYWNHLGWRDPWSDARWSALQGRYAAASGSSGVYTPQMVVNGRDQLLGSDPAAADAAIAQALARPAQAQVFLSVRRGSDPHEFVVDWRTSGAPTTASLDLAIAQASASDSVTRGENAGRKLAHVNVVRDVASQALASGSQGQWRPHLPEAAAGLLVVGCVRDRATSAIIGASAATVE